MRWAVSLLLWATLLGVAVAFHSGDGSNSVMMPYGGSSSHGSYTDGGAWSGSGIGDGSGSGWDGKSKCCRPPWGLDKVAMCSLDETWEALTAKLQYDKIKLKTGGLGTSSVRAPDGKGNRFDVWLCVWSTADFYVPCDTDGGAFCFVFDEINEHFVPWGLNSELRLFNGISAAPGTPKAMFAELDQNGDGCVDEIEFNANPPPVPASFADVSRGDDCIKYEEHFLPFLDRDDTKYAMAWTYMDADEDGCLTRTEFEDAAVNIPRDMGYSYDDFDSLRYFDDIDSLNNGEAACEVSGRGGGTQPVELTQSECNMVGCCHWNQDTNDGKGACWSSVGQNPCTGCVSFDLYMAFGASRIRDGCTDLPGDISGDVWHDGWHGCDEYAQGDSWCDLYGDDDVNGEGAAKNKCCFCGGGSTAPARFPYISGEMVCEGHGPFSHFLPEDGETAEMACEGHGPMGGPSCCKWDPSDGKCWSKVGDGVCPGFKLGYTWSPAVDFAEEMFFHHFDYDGSMCLSIAEFEKFAYYMGFPEEGLCNPSMCRTTDGKDGFDCYADGKYESFECADGYFVVMTGKVHESMVDVQEFTCCPHSSPEGSGSGDGSGMGSGSFGRQVATRARIYAHAHNNRVKARRRVHDVSCGCRKPC